jgi:hypothetical protein
MNTGESDFGEAFSEDDFPESLNGMTTFIIRIGRSIYCPADHHSESKQITPVKINELIKQKVYFAASAWTLSTSLSVGTFFGGQATTSWLFPDPPTMRNLTTQAGSIDKVWAHP